MAQNLNIDETLLAWADIVVKNWRRKITDLKIGATGYLFDSFAQEIIKSSGGRPERIDFMFAFYGRFVDMGVGRGMPTGGKGENPNYSDSRNDKGQLHVYNRKPKKWYSPVFYSQVIKLREILAEKYGQLGAAVISENITKGEKEYKPSNRSRVKDTSNLPANRPLTDLDREWMRRNGLL